MFCILVYLSTISVVTKKVSKTFFGGGRHYTKIVDRVPYNQKQTLCKIIPVYNLIIITNATTKGAEY